MYTAITTGGSSPARTPMGTLCVVSRHIVCLFPLFSIFILSQCTLYCYAICQIKYYHTISCALFGVNKNTLQSLNKFIYLRSTLSE